MLSDILTALAPHIAELVAGAIFALAAYVVALIRRKTGIDLEAQLRKIEAMHRAGIDQAVETWVLSAARRGDLNLERGLAYVRLSVPDAIAALRPSEDILRAKLEAAARKVGL